MSKLFTATVARYKLIKPAPYVASYQRHRIDGDVYYMHSQYSSSRSLSLSLSPFLFVHFPSPYCFDIFAHNVNVDKINNSPKNNSHFYYTNTDTFDKTRFLRFRIPVRASKESILFFLTGNLHKSTTTTTATTTLE